MKKLIKLTFVLVSLIVVLCVVGLSMIDKAAKTGIETVMTERLGVATTLSDINISLFDEACELNDFAIANPEGFSVKPFFSLNRGFVSVSAKSLMGDYVEVSKLSLDGIHVNLEQSGLVGNYDKIMEALGKGDNADDTGGKKRFKVKEIIVSNTVVSAQMLPTGDLLGELLPPVTIKIPEIRLQNVGSESENGALLMDVAGQVMAAVFVEIGDASGQLPGSMSKGFAGALGNLPNVEELTSRLTGGFEKGVGSLIEEGAGGLGTEVEKLGKGLSEGLGGLLGGSKKKKKK